MSIRSHRRKGLVAGAGLAGLLFITGALAFTAANTVPASKAGDGTGTVTGYTVSNIAYTLNGADPTTVDAVDFDVDVAPPAGATMKAQFDSTGGTWYTCTNTTTALTCDTTGAALLVVDVDQVRVVIAQS